MRQMIGCILLMCSLGFATGPVAADADAALGSLLDNARAEIEAGNYEAAVSALHDALRIARREEGEGTEGEAEILKLLASSHEAQGDVMAADEAARGAFEIAERTHGRKSPALLPALEWAAAWYQRTAQFDKARRAQESVVRIIQRDRGKQDASLVPAFRSIADRLLLEGRCCAYNPLEKAAAILDAGGSGTAAERAAFAIDLGDAYAGSIKWGKARGAYQRAWQLLEEQPAERARLFGAPRAIAGTRVLAKKVSQRRDARNYTHIVTDDRRRLARRIVLRDARRRPRVEDVVGHPIQFVNEEIRHLLRGEDPIESRLFVDLVFTVQDTGTVTDPGVRDTNAPEKLVQMLKRAIRDIRFRPRLVAGEPVATPGVVLRQEFEPAR